MCFTNVTFGELVVYMAQWQLWSNQQQSEEELLAVPDKQTGSLTADPTAVYRFGLFVGLLLLLLVEVWYSLVENSGKLRILLR